MKVTKRDTYTLTKPITELTINELRNLKFGLNFRWMAHIQKGHKDAADRCKAITDTIRAELARRVQDTHLNCV